jgi:hypothetical protein
MTGAEVLFMSKEALFVAQMTQVIMRTFGDNKIQGGRFSEIINGIPVTIMEKMNEVVSEVDDLEGKLKKANFDLSMSPNQCDEELSFWERNLLPNPLKDFNNKIYALKNDVTSLIENYIMIARCYECGNLVAKALKEAQATRTELDKLLNPSSSLQDMLKNVRGYADSVRKAVNASGQLPS